jgi:UDP:flavonoid glycosyltransferase YjiC (YdhE family)
MTRSASTILLATFGSLGDLHPFVALAHALKREGFSPVVATSEAYRGFIEQEGLSFAPIRPDVDDLTRRLGMDLGGIARRMVEDDAFLFREVIFPHLRQSYDDLLALSEGAALVAAHGLAFAAKAVAEKRGLPLVNVILSPLMFYSAYDPPLGSRTWFAREPRSPLAIGYNQLILRTYLVLTAHRAKPLRQLRRDVGLPPRRGLDLFAGATDATIGLYSPLLAPPQPDHPRGTLIAGHSFHDRYRGEGESALPALEAFLDAGPAPIVFTLGSFFTRDKSEHYRACFDAARHLGRRAVLLAHESDLAGLREGLPAEAFAAAYVPHSRVFPRSCAIVHHGGAGASGQALRAGRPQLVTPLSADQPDNAERLRRLGVARVLSGGAVTAAALARELAPLLGEGAYAARAREVGAQVAREDGAGAAAGRIGELLGRESRAERA